LEFSTEITTTPCDALELVRPARSSKSCDFPGHYRDKLVVDVVHDGAWIPEEFLVDRQGRSIERAAIAPHFRHERDWGAGLIANRLTAMLGLPGYSRVNVARVLMDFGRFPGSTGRHADHLHRFAINYPYSTWLSHAQKKRLLEVYYDDVSRRFEAQLSRGVIKLAIHTYDQFNESGTERPPVSLMTRSIGYQTSSEMPQGVFDPLYPDILGEFTADRVLRDRISLTLEKAGVAVAHNYPYCLPEGSLEVRYQVWAFFQHFRRVFEEQCPETVGEPGYLMVWEMLNDTNLRSSESETLRSYLHMYRRTPIEGGSRYEAAALAYEAIAAYLKKNRHEVVENYRFSPARPSSLALEVRKDVVCELDKEGYPIRVRRDNIEHIADTIAEAIAHYLRSDRREREWPDEELDHHQPWYSPPRD
jgi:hypothetical protein